MKKLLERLGFAFLLSLVMSEYSAFGQQIITIGQGNLKNASVSSSTQDNTGIRTLQQTGYLPNYNSASRFLSQSTLGPNLPLIQNVATIGIEKWLDAQLVMPQSFSVETYLRNMHQSIADSLNRTNPAVPYTINNVSLDDWHFDVAWFQGSMVAPDLLRWRVALALSEIFVISRISDFNPNPYALANYYDLLLTNSFGNYRTLLNKITYHASMGTYLTFLNNHATDIADGRQIYPDENYAREIMQLFSIGLYELNNDGTERKDVNGKSIPTYTNNDIAGLAKVFTGLSWGDSRYIGDNSKNYWSYTLPMKFFPIDSSDAKKNTWKTNPRIVNAHEPGSKTFLGNTIPNRPVAQGEQDIQDALNIIFNHPNVGPFIARRLIQRLVTSNPSAAYIGRVASVFNNNGSGVRGDLKAVVKAILLDQEARDCCAETNPTFGMLREPFVRYMNLMRGVPLTTTEGVYRNVMNRVYSRTEQRPLNANTVFNFFMPDYSPDGEVKDAGKVVPEFQLLNSQTLTGYVNALNDWLINDDPTDFYYLFSGEKYKSDQDPKFNLTADYTLVRNDKLPQFLDKYNLILAHGKLSTQSLDIIRKAISSMPYSEDANGVPNSTDAFRRARIALILIMSSPDYLINR